MTPSFESLRALDAVLQKMEGTSLAGTAFGERLGEMYADGVEWAVGVDLERLMGAAHGDQETLESLGLGDVQYVIAERKQVDGRTENRAELTFDQPRRRIAAWLAEPAPMGALDYVSPDASLAAGFVMKDMGVLVDELFDFIGEFNSDFTESLDRIETEEGIDIRRDFAKPLGGEFVVALDGPVNTRRLYTITRNKTRKRG